MTVTPSDLQYGDAINHAHLWLKALVVQLAQSVGQVPDATAEDTRLLVPAELERISAMKWMDDLRIDDFARYYHILVEVKRYRANLLFHVLRSEAALTDRKGKRIDRG